MNKNSSWKERREKEKGLYKEKKEKGPYEKIRTLKKKEKK